MALDAARLAAAMKTKCIVANPAYSGAIGSSLDWLFEALAEAVIDEIKTNAQVTTSVSVTSVSGVTAGLMTSGPGSGNGSGTIS